MESAGSSQPVCLPESCSGWPQLSRCQGPSPTSSAGWVGPFGGRRGLPDTSPHGDSGAGPWGALGPGQGNHHGRSWWGAGAVCSGLCVFVSVCVCVGAGLQAGPFPPPSPTLAAFPHCHQACGFLLAFVPPHQGLLLRCCLALCCLLPLACAFKRSYIASLL